jgi:hypothetical protein
MTKVVVTTELENHVTRRSDPDDRWDIGDEEGCVSNVIAYETEELQNYYGDSFGKELDVEVGGIVYAVVVDYSSGCTFGRTGAQGKVLDVFTDPKEAEALAEAALKPDGYRKDWGDRQVPTFDFSFEHNGQEYYRDWVGYFEDLQDLSVWEVQVRKRYDAFGSRTGDTGAVGYRRGH